MERNERLDIVRCIANYMIILLHASAVSQYCVTKGVEFEFWRFVCGPLCSSALPALFLISGYLLFCNFSLDSWLQKLKNRVKRLLVPYLAWNFLFVVFYIIAANFSPRLSARVDAFGLETIAGALSKIISLNAPPLMVPFGLLEPCLF